MYNPDIHYRKSIRLKNYDYSQNGYYFVTICTQDKEYLFGRIENGEMILNDYGKIVNNEWMKTAIMRTNVKLDQYVIMPNHIHGIIIINNRIGTAVGDTTAEKAEQFGKPTSNTIPTIVRGYKSSVTKQINSMRNLQGTPVWQRNYYEHIIREEKDLQKIREYIRNNIQMWDDENGDDGHNGNDGYNG